MSDSFTENTPEGFGSRIGNSIKGVLVGGLFFVGSFVFLGWNELRSVTQIRTLEEGRKVVVPIDAASPSPETEGKLVFLSGRASTEELLRDPVFGISTPGLKLRRSVTMYQWDEDKETSGSGSSKKTTYEYKKTWSSRLIDSHRFHYPSGHENPSQMPFESEETLAVRAHVGVHILSSGLIRQLSNYSGLTISEADLGRAPPTNALRPSLNGGRLAYVRSPGADTVGDLRVEFAVVPQSDVSIVSQHTGKTFSPYSAKTGKTLELLEEGIHPVDYVFDAAAKRNSLLTWALRAGGWFVMFLGLLFMLGPIEALASYVPFLGSIVGLGIGLAAFMLSLTLSLVTIAVCWIVVRPLFGGGILACAALLVYYAKSKGDRKIIAASLPAGAPPPPPPGAPVS